LTNINFSTARFDIFESSASGLQILLACRGGFGRAGLIRGGFFMVSATAQHPSRRILYIDHDEDCAQLTKWALENFGLQVTTLPDPMSALEILSDRPEGWDFLIAALEKSGQDELDGIMTIRTRHPDLHYALVAQSLTDEVVRQAEDSGVGPVLRKPATMNRFAALAELASH
jgi:DNA-binding NtrC family response regulator